MNLLNIYIIRKNTKKHNINWTKHCLNKLSQRDILISDVKCAINNGKIIEYYYNDYPYPSCLVAGNDTENKTLHVVCGIHKDMIYMITAYYPDNNKWNEDLKTRRKKQ